MILIPEVEIYQSLISLFKFVRVDFEENSQNQKSIIHNLFKGIKLSGIDFLESAVNILITKNDSDNPRKIDVNFGYNQERANRPTIHILMPSEEEVNQGLGENEGFLNFDIDQINTDDSGGFSNIKQNTSFSSSFTLLITSDNANETVLIYNFLKSMIFAMRFHFESKGFQNVKINGGDILFNEQFMPNIYTRNLNISFSYEFGIRNLFPNNIAASFKIKNFEK
jgi:hypothetical protein